MTKSRRGNSSGGRIAGMTDVISFDDNDALAILVGPHSRNLAEIERRTGADIDLRGNQLTVSGERAQVHLTVQVLKDLYDRVQETGELGRHEVDLAVRADRTHTVGHAPADRALEFRTPKRIIRPRTKRQGEYVEALRTNELVIGLGPAGTGKTYLAVAAGIALLTEGAIERLILSRPAVEAGEKLGFLPGNMEEKVDPYLRPLYDALHDMLSGDQITRRRDAGDIEIAPLAFMRGRTLSNAYVILDEAQNASPQQMKMFLTRLGEGSRMVVTGDPTQVDLPKGAPSGLAEAARILKGVEGVGIVAFDDSDVVRHELVQRIVRAYQAHESKIRRGQ